MSMGLVRSLNREYKSSGVHSSMARKAVERHRTAARASAVAQARQIQALDRYAATVYEPSGALRPGGWQRNTTTTMKAEKKVIDLNYAAYAARTSANVVTYLLNGCIQGTNNYNRIGRKIDMKSLQVHGMMQATTTLVVPEDNIVRWMIVYDRTPNGNAPTWANVVQSQNISATASSNSTDMINLDNRDRFIVVRDKVIPMAAQNGTAAPTAATATGQPTTYVISEYIRFNYETVYNGGNAGTVGDIQTGALYFFICSNQDQQVGFVGSFRVRFRES